MDLTKLEKILNLKFKNKKILERALTHRSWINEHQEKNLLSNERLEFLGDAILEFWVTKNLFNLFPHLSEGVLTNVRASLVCTENLAKKAKKIKLGDFLYLSRGEEKNEGRKNPSVLADAFEAIIGAIFVDQKLAATEKFLGQVFLEEIKKKGSRGDIKDSKTKFQELAQSKFKITPTYRVLQQKGPDHHRFFKVGAFLNSKKTGEGTGWSKQEAEEAAAKKGLTLIKNKVKY